MERRGMRVNGERLEVGELLHNVAQILKLSLGSVLLYVGVLSGAMIAVDLASPDGGGSTMLVNIASVVAGYLLIRVLVRDAGLAAGFERGFGAYFGLSLLSGLGLLLGFVCLVIPGLILFVRWQPAFAILMSEDDASVSGALEKAWQMTSGQFWPLLAAVLIGAAIMAVALLTYTAFDLGYGVQFEVSVIAGNILLSCASVYLTVLGVAAYALLRTEGQGLEEIFA